jgi:hypothetical protein
MSEKHEQTNPPERTDRKNELKAKLDLKLASKSFSRLPKVNREIQLESAKEKMDKILASMKSS